MTIKLRVGDAFPDFELPDHRKQPRRLSRYTRPSPVDHPASPTARNVQKDEAGATSTHPGVSSRTSPQGGSRA